MITALYNLFTNHNICPDDFYGVERNDFSRTIIVAFSQYEVKKHNDAIKEAERR